MSTLRLHGYYRSSAAFRVRIALNLKGIVWEPAAVNLLAGEQRSAGYLARNPQGLVPALELPDGTVLTQSPAIIEWLEEYRPEPPLLPREPVARARIRAICDAVACDIHPLNNLRVLRYLEHTLGEGKDARDAWYRHWVREGFAALEQQVGDGTFCAGESPGMAEAFLVPQVYNALRFEVDMREFPRIDSLYSRCLALGPFANAHPDAQPDRP
ncbi:MAG: maleylacetoacetate isomerase [Gammaproteobacteria bacterium]